RKPFFAMPDPLAAPRAPFGINPQPGHMVVVRRVETIVTKGRGNFSELFGPGIWELQVAHKGMPLTQAFEQTSRRNLLLSLGVEALMLVAIVFLVLGTQRMQRL